MITPIHRIPQLDAGVSLVKQVETELVNCTDWSLADSVMDLVTPDTDSRTAEDDQEIVLDYAMQLRSEFGLPWAQSIRIASIFYFG